MDHGAFSPFHGTSDGGLKTRRIRHPFPHGALWGLVSGSKVQKSPLTPDFLQIESQGLLSQSGLSWLRILLRIPRILARTKPTQSAFYLCKLRIDGRKPLKAILEGEILRLRLVLMTAATTHPTPPAVAARKGHLIGNSASPFHCAGVRPRLNHPTDVFSRSGDDGLGSR